jgi:hypothetical protein
MKNGREVPTAILVGLVGTARTEIVSGLRPGQQVMVTTTLPALGSSSATGSSSTLGGTSRLGSGLGRGAGFGGGGFTGGGLGGAGFSRGG